ncbi:phosphoenolpyruvate/phosphate translocator 1, chloroplastic-like [Dorcoceras hygrometricum]|uniref:Phosphoenolpyruvate/phosphate translocator 1, chloroplastic-like n=1 Tax=Dorcoceras hygrometricum TaxID=472368 RepID=A0A2Z7CT29_9LAMI|nr:phosphoenolpyruvate/phosphate translocator 1, chloroplastic-like [Dorcoceras hygrometricum]
MKRRRVEASADGLALMTSSVMSSYSADVARTSRKIPAGSICLIPAGQPDASNSSIQSRAYLNQLLLYIQSQASVDPVASFSLIAIQSTWIPRRKKRRSRRSVETKPVASYSIQSQGNQAQRIFSRSDKSAAKQLTIYESWMSTAELSHTVEAVVHVRSLGVLTAAACGIGSVHEVVRSNLLVVDPSEVEEGEM